MMKKRLYRSRTDRKIAGVAGGIAQYFDIDPTLVRVAFALMVLLASSGFWIYLALWLIIPEESASNRNDGSTTSRPNRDHDSNWSNF
ncbi:PspC domain-containing protein [Lapidilactobacillus mulanensis]|nr:PspC domain-containing protein [Lapidilactobacillus mulanensis]